MDIIKRIVHILAEITYVLIVVYALISLPILMKYKPLVVLTGSMEPTIKTGSIIYYTKTNANDLKENDIITFNSNGSYVTHRIVNIEDNLIETKGDANNASDPKRIEASDVVGRVASIYVPFLGYFVGFINRNMILSVIVVVIILILEFIFSNMKTSQNRKLKEE